MKVLPSSVEGWNTVFQAISVILIAGTVLAGAGAIITNRVMNRRQARDLAAANTEAAKANKGVADAGLEIAKAKEGTAQAVRDTARLTVEAEQAKKERAEADRQIAIAKTDALRAKEGIANAEARSTEAAAEVSRLQIVVANAEKSRAEAEKALLELQRRINWRRITPEQEKEMVGVLKQSPDKATVEISCVLGDGEGLAFALQIDHILKEAGWTTSGVNQGVYSPNNPIGLFIEVRSEKTVPQRAGLLQQAFTQVGIPLPGSLRPTLAEGAVLIVVGNKPQ
jgi:hypothetical protein